MGNTVAELSVDEFRQVIEETFEQKLLELFGDPDEGLELREEVKSRLRRSLKAERDGVRGIPAKDVAAELGLDW